MSPHDARQYDLADSERQSFFNKPHPSIYSLFEDGSLCADPLTWFFKFKRRTSPDKAVWGFLKQYHWPNSCTTHQGHALCVLSLADPRSSIALDELKRLSDSTFW
ncbi:hypothetical protein TWF225_006115 [Orbilia oligospora]|uniref:Uncharacterized protein n=1 Tax=Orbilia oligospora TaxID=2813651 RepID=A0A7C8TSP1_ORBOL|nr:hypothetical protein TWF751_002347 [Orbilia oligospora]KAF3183639.1 hypothetical protein TWF225_006115 [Orbilia oligospora]KAF3247511.1 hypothetical protein TWF128_008590 [Orbilia oligospora]KAF3250855.1 hypothetical protein TWF217_008467 [Orbilia oligospora]TGJ67129.1 hypothetical protein EYR41_008705 [Orbilia oligospora]